MVYDTKVFGAPQSTQSADFSEGLHSSSFFPELWIRKLSSKSIFRTSMRRPATVKSFVLFCSFHEFFSLFPVQPSRLCRHLPLC